MVDVQRQRSYGVEWRFISLWMVNDDNHADWYTPEYRAGHYFGHQGLRIADTIRLGEPDPAAVGRWYTALGTALHVDKRRAEARDDADKFFRGLLADTGLDESYAAAADDDTHDEYLRADCQNTTSRPRAFVNTNCDLFSRARSSTRSMATPRRTHDKTDTRSTISRSPVSGHSVAGWQNTLAVRGHVSLTFRTTGRDPTGNRTRNGSDDAGSGFRVMTNSTPQP